MNPDARKRDAVDSPQRERVRRDLHHAGRVAGVEHSPERPLQVDGLGRRACDRLRAPADALLDGAEQAGTTARCLEDGAHEERHGGLAVRTGHAGDLKGL